MSWLRRLRRILTSGTPEKENCSGRRVQLRLEELETRALPSASSVLAGAATSAPNDLTAQPNSSLVTPAASSAFSGYTPQQLQTAYHVPAAVNGQLAGSGETIAIVDAYNDPNIASDLATFDGKYGLPTANLSVVNQNGSKSNLPAADPSWGVEESLDVEWAHAIAPGAKIVLVEANSANLGDLLTAVSTAGTTMHANVVSMSWGTSEFSGETAYDKYFSAPGVTYVASAGDSSAYVGPEWPASSPNVLAVGGTTLNLTSSNTIASESAWSATFSWYYGFEGGGGGISSYEPAPSFQSSIPVAQAYGARTTPDVSWVANPGTGVSVYDSFAEPGWGYVGGTSVGAPSWAGVVSIADQQSVANGHGNLSTAQVEKALYGSYSSSGGANYTSGSAYTTQFNDITTGSNGYQATKGYDLATGLGSPKVNAIVTLLAGTPPASPATGSTSSTSPQGTGPSTPHQSNHPSGRAQDVLGGSDTTSSSVATASATNSSTSLPTASATVQLNINTAAGFDLALSMSPAGLLLDGSLLSSSPPAAAVLVPSSVTGLPLITSSPSVSSQAAYGMSGGLEDDADASAMILDVWSDDFGDGSSMVGPEAAPLLDGAGGDTSADSSSDTSSDSAGAGD
jgi:subtilase family serine protease